MDILLASRPSFVKAITTKNTAAHSNMEERMALQVAGIEGRLLT